MLSTTELAMVKNAKLSSIKGVYEIVHYDTVIFNYDSNTGTTFIKKNCSQASNRQIKNALSFFGLDEIDAIEISPDMAKWFYSGEYVR